MTRRRILSSEELDVHTGWRRYLVYLQRAGATAKVKRRTRRRERREGVQETRRESGEAAQ